MIRYEDSLDFAQIKVRENMEYLQEELAGLQRDFMFRLPHQCDEDDTLRAVASNIREATAKLTEARKILLEG